MNEEQTYTLKVTAREAEFLAALLATPGLNVGRPMWAVAAAVSAKIDSAADMAKKDAAK